MIKPIRSESIRKDRDAPKSPMTGLTPRLRPAQAAPVRRGQSAGEGISGGADGRWDGCVPAWTGRKIDVNSPPDPFAGGDED
jgi:hypothetical protein